MKMNIEGLTAYEVLDIAYRFSGKNLDIYIGSEWNGIEFVYSLFVKERFA